MKVMSSLRRRGTQKDRRKLKQKKLMPTKQRTSYFIRVFSKLKRAPLGHVIKPGMETEMERNEIETACPLLFLPYVEQV